MVCENEIEIHLLRNVYECLINYDCGNIKKYVEELNEAVKKSRTI